MNYLDAMATLSQCGLGAVILSEDKKVLSINEAGDRLLHGNGHLEGNPIPKEAELLGETSDQVRYVNIAFDEYLCRCETPEVTDLPPHARMIVFRQAAGDAYRDMLTSALNGISEAVILCDAQGRICLLNDVAVDIDSIVTSDVLGRHVSEVYQMQKDKLLAFPEVIRDKRPKLNLRQNYTTCFGKNVEIIANFFPIVQNGQTLGAFNVLQDWSAASELHRQIIDLQGKLLEQSAASGTKEKSALTARYQFGDIIHISTAMNKIVTRGQKIAPSDSSVMIYGETGTGKELLAQSIHNASRRANGPFLAINCAAIPENLLEGLLFGTEKGAYTGAESRPGLFEQADGGTLLLDEINSMNISLQTKLLRVLQDGMVRRVGGAKEIHVDVRVLSNTNTPPDQAIEENRLRQDLFYRLGVINISIPPLREHKEDIPLLSKDFILRFNKKLQKHVRDIDRETLEIFNAYQWPGNVRELEHTIEYAMNILPNDRSVITLEDLPDHIVNATAPFPCGDQKVREKTDPISTAMQETESQLLRKALAEHGGNIARTARSFGISRQNLQYRIRRSGIDVKSIRMEKYK